MLQVPIIQNTLRGANYLLRRYRNDRCSEIAAALVYMSLFALVPLLTVLYAIGSAIPTASNLEVQLEQLLVTNLLPDASQEVAAYLRSFSDQAKKLTGFGIAILFVTAVLMMRNVERALNNIWQISNHRGAVSSFLLYWAVLTLAPVLLGLGFGIQAYLYAAANAIAGVDTLGISAALLSLLPFGLSVLGIAALYVAVPNCSVPLRHALLGGVVTTLAFSIAKSTFTAVIANSSYTLVYGAFAAVPVFLLWLYVIWNIVLLGGILVHSLSAYQTEEQASRPRQLKALDVLHRLWLAQRAGESVGELEILSSRGVLVGLDSDSWRSIRDTLVSAKLIAQDAQGRYRLAQDLGTVTLSDFKELINGELAIPQAPRDASPWQQRAVELLQAQRGNQQKLLSLSIARLFQTDPIAGSGQGPVDAATRDSQA